MLRPMLLKRQLYDLGRDLNELVWGLLHQLCASRSSRQHVILTALSLRWESQNLDKEGSARLPEG